MHHRMGDTGRGLGTRKSPANVSAGLLSFARWLAPGSGRRSLWKLGAWPSAVVRHEAPKDVRPICVVRNRVPERLP